MNIIFDIICLISINGVANFMTIIGVVNGVWKGEEGFINGVGFNAVGEATEDVIDAM